MTSRRAIPWHETRFLRLSEVACILGESEHTVLDRVERGELKRIDEEGRRMVKFSTREVVALANRIERVATGVREEPNLSPKLAASLAQVERELGLIS